MVLSACLHPKPTAIRQCQSSLIDSYPEVRIICNKQMSVKAGMVSERRQMRCRRDGHRTFDITSNHYLEAVGASRGNHPKGFANSTAFHQFNINPIHGV